LELLGEKTKIRIIENGVKELGLWCLGKNQKKYLRVDKSTLRAKPLSRAKAFLGSQPRKKKAGRPKALRGVPRILWGWIILEGDEEEMKRESWRGKTLPKKEKNAEPLSAINPHPYAS
jgi:hypothetical protein